MTTATKPKPPLGRDESELMKRLRKAELLYRRALAHSCVVFEQLEAAKRKQIAAGDEVRRLSLEVELERSKTR